MKPPRIPPMVTDIVQTAVCSFDRSEYVHLAACPYCGGPVQGYDTREKKYATVREGSSTRTITVRIKRFTCRRCKRLSNADEPFYPGTRLGSLIVDLYFSLASTMPGSRAARIIDTIGIEVDRTTWRNYASRPMPEIEAADIFGMRIPRSIIAVSTIAAGIPEGGSMNGAEALAVSNIPSAFRSAAVPGKKGRGHGPLRVPDGEAGFSDTYGTGTEGGPFETGCSVSAGAARSQAF